MENNQNEEYEYNPICIWDYRGCCCEIQIDEVLDYNMGLWDTREEKIAYLNDFIKDIEHYRDSLK